jgi:ribosome-associated protein
MSARTGLCGGRRETGIPTATPFSSPFARRILSPRAVVVRYGQERVLKQAHVKQTAEIQTTVPTWLAAVRAAESKKATDIRVLDLTGITSFADYFVICTGANQRQVQAIGDEVNLQLKRRAGELPISVEGYDQAEWVLADYGDLLVHIFSPKARAYYDLERLWRGAKLVEIPEE